MISLPSLSFHSHPVPSVPFHSPPLEVGPLNPAKGSEERCRPKLSQQGLGRAPAEIGFLVHLALKSDMVILYA